MFKRSSLYAAVTVVIWCLASVAQAADGLVVHLDRARVMSITEPVATIIIGNPTIADASMPDQNTLVLTGKSYGETNLLMLDSQGAIMGEHTIFVRGFAQNQVSVYRKSDRASYSCTPFCEQQLTLGDNIKLFDEYSKNIETRNGMATSNANGESQ